MKGKKEEDMDMQRTKATNLLGSAYRTEVMEARRLP